MAVGSNVRGKLEFYRVEQWSMVVEGDSRESVIETHCSTPQGKGGKVRQESIHYMGMLRHRKFHLE